MVHMPEAPLPPPPFAMHPSPHHLPAEMERLNLDHGVPPFGGHGGGYSPSFDGRFVSPGPQFDAHLPLDGNGKVPVDLEGWTFTKQPAVRPDQKETWALVLKTPMTATQAQLRDQVTKQKKKGTSAAAQLASSEMAGFKRKQVERLISDRTRTDPDARFEYKLAALRLRQEIRRQGKQTVSMDVVLKRQLRPGLAQPSSSYDRIQELDGEIVDLTGAEETNYSHDGQSASLPSQHVHPPVHGQQPLYMEHTGAAFIHDPRFPPQAVPHHGSAPVQQGHEQYMPQPNMYGFPPEAVHTPMMPKEDKDKKDKHAKDDKKDKVKVHQKKERKDRSYSDSSSESWSEADSWDSKAYTDRTPDTEYSGGSRGSYHKDKKHPSSHKESRRDSHSYDKRHSQDKHVYRERRRKSPVPSPTKGASRYDYEDYDIVMSERHRDRDRDQPYRGSHKASQGYVRERPLTQGRALSYDDERHVRPAYGQARRLQSYASPADLRAEKEELQKEELQWEIEEIRKEKLREKLEHERAERDRLELRKLEREKLESERLVMEMERERQERDRAERDRLDRLDRERERYERDRFGRDRMDRERFERDRFDRDRYNRDLYAEAPPRYPMAYEPRREERYYR